MKQREESIQTRSGMRGKQREAKIEKKTHAQDRLVEKQIKGKISHKISSKGKNLKYRKTKNIAGDRKQSK